MVASGPSASDVPLDRAKGKARFIAVNNSWELVPWADIFFACDYRWWQRFRSDVPEAGLKLTSDKNAADEMGLAYIKCAKPDDRLSDG